MINPPCYQNKNQEKDKYSEVVVIKIGDQFNYHGTWYRITEINGNMATTIEDPDLNRYPNIRDFTYWNIEQIEELVEKS